MKSFKELALAPEIAKALQNLGFETPTEIQAKAIPLLLDSKNIDIHGQAQTGTGKTLAFGIPLIQNIDATRREVQGLIVAPTRELVVQICQSLRSVAQETGIEIAPIYGGVSMEEQIRQLRKGVHIVVGTPGRLNDHLRRKTLTLGSLSTLVLDEADIMLDMGFKEEVDEILNYAPRNRQIWLFSATVKQGISDIMRVHMKDPVSVRVSQQNVGTTKTEQFYCVVPMRDRIAALSRFIDSVPEFYGFIFCQTKILTAEVAEHLNRRGYAANALHGDMSQVQRNRVIKMFKQREFTILVATDVAARGIDVSDLTHVINYSLPDDQESYVHRIGRTGRAGKEGTAITFVSQSETRYIGGLQRKFKVTIQPIVVPSSDAIAQVRMKQAGEYLKESIAQSTNSTYSAQLQSLIDTFPTADLSRALVSLLDEKFFKHVASDQNIKFAPTVHLNADRDDGMPAMKELCLNVGSDDGITKSDVLDWLADVAKLDVKNIERIKVIKRRTFIVVKPEHAHDIVERLKGETLGGRRVRVDINQYSSSGASSDRFAARKQRGGGNGNNRFGRSGGRNRSNNYTDYAFGR